MFFSRRIKGKLPIILVSRMVTFFLIISLLTLVLYAAGTVQGFIDSTQLSLLRLYSVLGIFLVVTSICGIALELERFIRIRKTRYILNAVGYFVLVIFGAVTVLAVIFIITVSGGNVK